MSRPMVVALAIVLCVAAGWGWQAQRRLTRLECVLWELRIEERAVDIKHPTPKGCGI